MNRAINIKQRPALKDPILICGFDGWGNALNVSMAMVTYLIHTLKGEPFARISPDLFYRYDASRPKVTIEKGTLKSISPPGGSFYAVASRPEENDLIILKANEPTLQWIHFVEELLCFCETFGVTTLIGVGSLFDNVLHTDRIVSGIASNDLLQSSLRERNVMAIDYEGPSSIHSWIHSEAKNQDFQCINLWCHCPYYLEGTTHFGLLAHLGSLLSTLGKFQLDVDTLEISWKEVSRKIQGLIEGNPELSAMINEIKKARLQGSRANRGRAGQPGEKIIYLKDFLGPGGSAL